MLELGLLYQCFTVNSIENYKKIWNLKFIHIIIHSPWVLGSFTPNLPKNLEMLLGVQKIGSLLKAALIVGIRNLELLQ